MYGGQDEGLAVVELGQGQQRGILFYLVIKSVVWVDGLGFCEGGRLLGIGKGGVGSYRCVRQVEDGYMRCFKVVGWIQGKQVYIVVKEVLVDVEEGD